MEQLQCLEPCVKFPNKNLCVVSGAIFDYIRQRYYTQILIYKAVNLRMKFFETHRQAPRV